MRCETGDCGGLAVAFVTVETCDEPYPYCQECTDTLVGGGERVVEWIGEFPITDEMVERAARKLAAEFDYEYVFVSEPIGTNYTADHWRDLARGTLAAAFTTTQGETHG
jgi:hypothetical protein